MTPYPKLFPADSAGVVTHAAFNYKEANKADVAAAVWDLVGFGLGQYFGPPTDKFGEVPEASFNGLVAARDPKKEKQALQTILGFLSIAYGASLFNKDPGIPAVLLGLNSLVVREWATLVETYWSAKGL